MYACFVTVPTERTTYDQQKAVVNKRVTKLTVILFSHPSTQIDM